jgi:acyl carrier protein
MVLENRFIHELDRPSFAAALDPKALGAWNLHEATRHRTLDCFVLFSSFAAVVGAFRQANYNAGNTFLDELAAHRRSLGLPGLSISWGSLAGTGYVERNRRTLAYLETTGVEAYGIDEVLALLGQLLRTGATALAAAKVDWSTLSRLAPAVADSPVFREVIGARSKGAGISRALLLAAAPEQRPRLVEDFLAAQIAAVFGAEEGSLDRTRSVTQLGLDSLMAIELLNRIEAELGIHFPVGSLLSGPSIRDLAVPVLEALAQSETRGEEATTPDESHGGTDGTPAA